jgi:hypothetical protein
MPWPECQVLHKRETEMWVASDRAERPLACMSRDLCQGTASAVPQEIEQYRGFSPCGFFRG